MHKNTAYPINMEMPYFYIFLYYIILYHLYYSILIFIYLDPLLLCLYDVKLIKFM